MAGRSYGIEVAAIRASHAALSLRTQKRASRAGQAASTCRIGVGAARASHALLSPRIDDAAHAYGFLALASLLVIGGTLSALLAQACGLVEAIPCRALYRLAQFGLRVQSVAIGTN